MMIIMTCDDDDDDNDDNDDGDEDDDYDKHIIYIHFLMTWLLMLILNSCSTIEFKISYRVVPG